MESPENCVRVASPMAELCAMLSLAVCTCANDRRRGERCGLLPPTSLSASATSLEYRLNAVEMGDVCPLPCIVGCESLLAVEDPCLCPALFVRVQVYVGGSVAEWLGCWNCDQQVAGSNPGLPAVECNPGQVLNTHVLLFQYNLVPASGR